MSAVVWCVSGPRRPCPAPSPTCSALNRRSLSAEFLEGWRSRPVPNPRPATRPDTQTYRHRSADSTDYTCTCPHRRRRNSLLFFSPRPVVSRCLHFLDLHHNPNKAPVCVLHALDSVLLALRTAWSHVRARRAKSCAGARGCTNPRLAPPQPSAEILQVPLCLLTCRCAARVCATGVGSRAHRLDRDHEFENERRPPNTLKTQDALSRCARTSTRARPHASAAPSPDIENHATQ